MPRSSARRAIASPAAAARIDHDAADHGVDPDRIRDDSPPAAAEIAVLPVARASIAEVVLARCFVDERNPRCSAAPEDIDELVASIEACGLLQPLVATDLNGLGVGVLDGRRRLAALLRLQAEGKWGQTAPAVMRADDGSLTTVAVAAQVQRVALSPAQEARAFGRMLGDALARPRERASASDDIVTTRAEAVAGIAKAFGVGVRHVEQRLTLAGLHAPILDALDRGKIDLDVAKAYARADANLQAKVWEKTGPTSQPFTIKQALDKASLDAGDALAVFVGEAAYVAAGGQVVRDFFGAEDDGAWADRKLAVKLAQQKLDDAKARVEAEGWSFVETMTKEPRPYDWKKATGTKRKATDAEQQTLKDIAARQKAIAQEEEAIYTGGDGDADITPEEQARLTALEDENNRLDEQVDEIQDGLIEYDAKAKAKAGAIVYITDNGGLRVWRGVKKVERTSHAAPTSSAPAKPVKQEEPEITREVRDALATHTAGVIGVALAAKPGAALAMLAHDLTIYIFGRRSEHELFVIDLLGRPPARPFKGGALSEDRKVQHARWFAAVKPHLKKPGALIRELLTWTPAALTDLIAFCVGEEFNVNFGWNPDAADIAKTTAYVAPIGAHLAIDPGFTWTPTLDVMKGFSAKALLGFCAELGINAAANAQKAQLAAMVADKAALVKWVPPIVRDLCGAAWTPLHATKKKRGRPSNAEKAARAPAPDPAAVEKAIADGAAHAAKKKPAKKAAPQKIARKSTAKKKEAA